nr:hypothetical protein [Tanacetum cinerariifolium]
MAGIGLPRWLTFISWTSSIHLGHVHFLRDRVSDAVHKSRDPQALWSSIDMHVFCFEALHEGFCQLSFTLFDVVDFHRILDVFLLLREVPKERFPQDLIAIYGFWWEFVEPDSGRTNQCGVEHMAPRGHGLPLDFAAVWRILR